MFHIRCQFPGGGAVFFGSEWGGGDGGSFWSLQGNNSRAWVVRRRSQLRSTTDLRAGILSARDQPPGRCGCFFPRDWFIFRCSPCNCMLSSRESYQLCVFDSHLWEGMENGQDARCNRHWLSAGGVFVFRKRERRWYMAVSPRKHFHFFAKIFPFLAVLRFFDSC